MSRGSTWLDVIERRARWCVVEGDCLDAMAEMPRGHIHHVITDPPYEVEAHKGARRVRAGGGVGVHAIDFAPMTEVLRMACGEQWRRLVERWALAFCQVEAVGAWRNAMGGKWRRAGVWIKPDSTPQVNGNGWAQGVEAIACAYMGRGCSEWNGGGRRGVLTHCRDPYRPVGEHPTIKPVSLMLELVTLFTGIDDLILDPFAGSGTTGVAAIRAGRRVILIEQEPKWAELCRERLEAEDSQLDLAAARSGQIGLWHTEAKP